MKLEEERQALAAFVKKFDSLGLSTGLPLPPTKLNPPMPTPGGAAALFAQRQRSRMHSFEFEAPMSTLAETDSPLRLGAGQPSLLEEEWDAVDDVSFGEDKLILPPVSKSDAKKKSHSPVRGVLDQKENMPV